MLAELDVQAARDEVVAELQKHLVDVTQAYWELYLRRTNRLQKERHCERAVEILQRLEDRLSVDAVQSQVLAARAAVTTRQAELNRAAMAVRNAESRIRTLVSAPRLFAETQTELIPASGPQNDLCAVMFRDALVTAMSHRPEVDRALLATKSAGVRLQMSEKELLPALNLVLETYVAGLEGRSLIGRAITNQFSTGEPGYTAGLTFEVPLGNRAARARYDRRQLELHQVTNELRDDGYGYAGGGTVAPRAGHGVSRHPGRVSRDGGHAVGGRLYVRPLGQAARRRSIRQFPVGGSAQGAGSAGGCGIRLCRSAIRPHAGRGASEAGDGNADGRRGSVVRHGPGGAASPSHFRSAASRGKHSDTACGGKSPSALGWPATTAALSMSLTQFAVHWWPSFLAAAPHRAPTPADQQLVVRIRSAAEALRGRSAQELPHRVAELRRTVAEQRLAIADPRVIEPAFALVHEAVRRCMGLEYYDVQFVAGLALARGQIAELATGEGKTLVQALAASVFALRGKGVHVMTSNAYLAERDCRQLVPVLRLLGLTVGLVRTQASPREKQQAYLADVTYGPGYEFGFDYLRDQITKQPRTPPQLGESYRRQFRGERPVEPLLMQRGHAVAIIDEADSVLIDEATLPLILAAGGNAPSGGASVYHRAAAVAGRLNAAVDFVLDPRRRRARLTDSGLNKVMDAGWLPESGLLEQAWPAYIEQALVARYLLCRDVDYVVDQDQVMLVDESTGRVFADRSLQHGLHQAVEAKEQVSVTAERRALAKISRQQFFRLYETLCGMTGTAQGGEREFRQIFHLGVTLVPPRHVCRRTVIAPRFFADKPAKRNAVVAEIRERQAVGQPVLVGTRTIEESRCLAELLANGRRGIRASGRNPGCRRSQDCGACGSVGRGHDRDQYRRTRYRHRPDARCGRTRRPARDCHRAPCLAPCGPAVAGTLGPTRRPGQLPPVRLRRR